MAKFFGKRFKNILPFFGILVLLDVIISPSISALYEAFADVTLLFGFLPEAGNISVIGVGWFLGLICVFYICFPFFCVLIENRRRAWISFAVSLFYNFVCSAYFGVDRKNILYSACYFLAGGLIYLYRKEISKWNRWLVLCVLLAAIVAYYIVGANTVMLLLVSSLLLIYAVISHGCILQNRITEFLSGISMEIYLSHMVIFRAIEKMNLNQMIGVDWIQYIVIVVLVLGGTILFAAVMQKVIENVENKLNTYMLKKKK